MNWNTVERAIKTETEHKNRIKRSEQARLLYVKDTNSHITTTWRWTRGEEMLQCQCALYGWLVERTWTICTLQKLPRQFFFLSLRNLTFSWHFMVALTICIFYSRLAEDKKKILTFFPHIGQWWNEFEQMEQLLIGICSGRNLTTYITLLSVFLLIGKWWKEFEQMEQWLTDICSARNLTTYITLHSVIGKWWKEFEQREQ